LVNENEIGNGISDNGDDSDPSPIHTPVIALPWLVSPNFVEVILLAFDLPPTQMGDYQVQGTSPALNVGVNTWLGAQASPRPTFKEKIFA
jgi:hypothetical protein